MLAAARAGEIDIIIAEDCSRLWRNLAEQAPRLAELADLGVHVITQDLDTRHDSAEWMGPILGAGAQHYRKEIARRTRRGLEGRARAGRSAGGRAYGYLSQAEAGERQVDPERAPIVRELFERFARGESLRALANDLNARGVPSPGAAWRRTQRAGDGLWRISALHALLQNEIYTGRVVWNKSRWVRAASDSKRRRRIENPPDQWIVHERPDLALVDEVTWRRVQERFRERGEVFAPGRGGRATYLLSGLLRCGVCGGAFIVGAHRPVRYACATRRAAGNTACSNHLMVARELAEDRILTTLRDEILGPDARRQGIARMEALARLEATAASPEVERLEEQLRVLERLRLEAVLSPEIAGAAIIRAKREIEAAKRAAVGASMGLFGAEAAWDETVAEWWRRLDGEDIPAARSALRDIVGFIWLHPREHFLVAQLTAGRIPLAVNWNGSGGALWTELRRVA